MWISEAVPTRPPDFPDVPVSPPHTLAVPVLYFPDFPGVGSWDIPNVSQPPSSGDLPLMVQRSLKEWSIFVVKVYTR